jgi:hypothetical protein
VWDGAHVRLSSMVSRRRHPLHTGELRTGPKDAAGEGALEGQIVLLAAPAVSCLTRLLLPSRFTQRDEHAKDLVRALYPVRDVASRSGKGEGGRGRENHAMQPGTANVRLVKAT